MEALESICRTLPEGLADRVREMREKITELRLRPNRPAQLCFFEGDELFGEPMDASAVNQVARCMLEYSLYAWEDELRQGFFTLAGGARVGICGSYRVQEGKILALTHIGSLCVRVAREALGAGEEVFREIAAGNALKSAVILSPPGMGKTTMLRDAARLISRAGWNVAVADERGELAACREGVPRLDVGPRTDVMDLCPKHLAIPHLVRSMRPDIVLTDELGDRRDADAVLDAKRCGCRVLATAHAQSLEEALRREAMARMFAQGAFDRLFLLGDRPGKILEIRNLERGKQKCG